VPDREQGVRQSAGAVDIVAEPGQTAIEDESGTHDRARDAPVVLRPGPKRGVERSSGEGGEDAGAKSSAGESGAEADDESMGVVDGPALRAGDEPAAIASGTGTTRWLCGLCTSACSDG
jgi:hypothetical protein